MEEIINIFILVILTFIIFSGAYNTKFNMRYLVITFLAGVTIISIHVFVIYLFNEMDTLLDQLSLKRMSGLYRMNLLGYSLILSSVLGATFSIIKVFIKVASNKLN